MSTRLCEICQADITNHHGLAKYCSKGCRRRAATLKAREYRRLMRTTKDIDGKKFSWEPYVVSVVLVGLILLFGWLLTVGR